MPRIRDVRKRDDRVVPFDGGKITDAIYKAIRSVGKGSRELAGELSAAVVHFLEDRFEGRIPGIEEIQDVVETVLIETGHVEVAKAYILYRNKRATLRETLQVRKSPPVAGGESDAGPWVEEQREGVSPWSKSKITAALIREADMDPSIAEEIASVVERKVFDSGAQRISTSLLRELVDNELFERGFDAKLQRQVPLGLPKYDLEQIISGLDSKEGYLFPKTPVEVREFIASRILKQYALQEVYSPAVADAHRDGRLHLHQLADPIRLDEVIWCLPLPLVASPSPSRSPVRRSPVSLVAELERAFESAPDIDGGGHRVGRRVGRAGRGVSRAAEGDDAWLELGGDGARADACLDQADLFRRLAQLGHFVHGEIRLRALDRLLAGARGGRGSVGDRVAAALERLVEIEEILPGSRLTLELRPGDGATPWLETLLAREARIAVRLFWRPDDVADACSRRSIELASQLFAHGAHVDLVPVLGGAAGGYRRRAGPGAVLEERRSGLRAVSGKVTLNLPQAAFRSARRRSGRIEEELDELVDLALKALLERKQFLTRLGGSREGPLWDVLGRPQNADGAPLVSIEDIGSRIGIVGLNECVRFLTGFELDEDPRAVHKGLELVAEIRRKVRREERGLGLDVSIEETPFAGAIRRIESLDRRTYPQFEEVDHGRGRRGQGGDTYTGGVRIHPAAPVDPLRRLEHVGRFLPEVAARDLLGESPELRGAGAELVVCLLEEAARAFASRTGAMVSGTVL